MRRSRRRWLLGAALGLALSGSGCTPSGPRSLTLSLEQMQERLSTRFPRRYPVAGLAELNLQTPRLSLRPERNRINAVMAVEASGPALRRTYSGSMDVDFALRFEPSDQTVRATELEVLALQFEGLPAQASTLLAGLGPALVGSMDSHDALRAGLLTEKDVPGPVRAVLGESHGSRARALIGAVVRGTKLEQQHAVKMDVEVDGKPIGQTAAQSYLYRELTPGKHTVTAKAENIDSLEIDAQPGKLSFIWQEVKMGVVFARTKLHLVDEKTGRSGVMGTRLAEGL